MGNHPRMPFTLKADFYELSMPPGEGPSFRDLVRIVDAIPTHDEARAIEIRDCPIRLQEVHLGRDYIEFEMLKIRMTDVAPKAKPNGDLEPIELEDDQGLGERTACLYHTPTSTLVAQHNHYGPSASTVMEYFRRHGKVDGDIELLPRISREGWQTVSNWDEYRAIDIHVAGFGNSNLDGMRQGTSLLDMARMSQRHGALKSSFRLWMGQKREGTLKGIVALIREVMAQHSRNDQQVEKVIVSGRNQGDKTRAIDLIKHRIREEVPVPEGDNRYVEFSSRRRALRTAWERRQQEITEQGQGRP